MKKTFYSLAIACVGLLVASCVQPLDPDIRLSGGKATLNLSAYCVSPDTKATTPGVSGLNENKILTLDYFVYLAQGDDVNAKFHERVTYPATGQGSHPNVTEPFDVVTLEMDDQIPASKTLTCYVYVLANLPAEYSHTTEGIKYSKNGTTQTYGTKLSALKKLPLVASFDVLTTEGKFAPQPSFVMASQVESVTLDEDHMQQTVLTQLSRAASKITLDLSIVSAIDEVTATTSGRDTLFETYVQSWYPDVNSMQVYLSYANSHTTLDRTLYPERNSDNEWTNPPYSYDVNNFFTFNRFGFTPTITQSGGKWNVTGTPFYTYPMTWNTYDSNAPFIKIILPWRAYNEGQDNVEYDSHYQYIVHEQEGAYRQGQKFLSVPHTNINNTSATPQEFFYKISLPLDDNTLMSNTWYGISLDVGILGGTSDDLTMEVAGNYYVVDWNDPHINAGGNLQQGSYLKIAEDTYYMYGEDEITIPVMSSHDISTVTVNSAQYFNFYYNSGAGRYESLSSSSYSTSKSGRESFTLKHNLHRDITQSNLDCSIITFKVTVTNGAGLSKQVTIIQYPPLYITSEDSNKNVFINGVSNGFSNDDYKRVYETGFNNNSPNERSHRLGTIRRRNKSVSGNDNFHIYTIHVSSLVGTSWSISDPRSDTGVNYPNLKGTSESGTSLTNYKATDANASDKIAPSFKVASSSGASYTNSDNDGRVTRENSHKRCAAYQENGYPAGRWRVPTEAEIKFCIKLSDNNKLPSLFDGQYWAANGKIIKDDGSYGDGHDQGGQKVAAVRCVYDAWYWGDSPMSSYLTTWSGWQN